VPVTQFVPLFFRFGGIDQRTNDLRILANRYNVIFIDVTGSKAASLKILSGTKTTGMARWANNP
jgi:hypothetical protein